jgi:hypothetical protein
MVGKYNRSAASGIGTSIFHLHTKNKEEDAGNGAISILGNQ